MKAVGLVLNPVKVDDAAELVDLLGKACADLGWKAPQVRETTEQDAGHAMARELVDAGCDLIVAAGGDGTVRCVAQALAGSGVPMGVIPAGTGNLLARNLTIPLTVKEAVPVAVGGVERTLDVGVLAGAPGEDGMVFTVMAGIGFDAAMMRDAPEKLKDKVGWPAYIVGGIRGMRRRRVRLTLRIDDAPPTSHVARTVLVGNCGELQGGLALLPDAQPDDGLLDIAVVSPTRPRDWVVLLVRAVRGNLQHDHRMATYRGSHIRLAAHRNEPRQVDGDLVPDAPGLDITVQPAALTLMVPRPEATPA